MYLKMKETKKIYNKTRDTLLKRTYLLFKTVYEDGSIIYPILSIKKYLIIKQ